MPVIISTKHLPCARGSVLGLGGYFGMCSTVVCLRANNDGHFVKDGITNNSILFVDKSKGFRENGLNVFKDDVADPCFTLSKTTLPGQRYLGRVIFAINQYEED